MNLIFKNYYWRWLKNQIFLFLFVLFILSLARLGFSYIFGEWKELMLRGQEFRSAMFLGMRYDLMPLAYINIIPFLAIHIAYFIPGKRTIKGMRFFLVNFLWLGYAILGWLYIFDYAFYSYFQDHLNFLFFGFLEDDTVALLTSIWKNYNLPFWLAVFALIHYVGYRILKITFSPFDFDLKTKKQNKNVLISFLTGIILLGLFARGNFTRLPLSLEDAHISSNEFINELSLNGVLTFNRALKIRKQFGQKEVDYLKNYGFQNWQEAYEVYTGHKPTSGSLTDSLKTKSRLNPEAVKNPPHVVLVVMESFGTYWNENQSEKFNVLGSLGDHFKSGLLFKNFLSAENGTIGSIVSVATSQVIRPGARFLSESDFMNNALKSAGHMPYQDAGYDTHFIYGGKLGWRDLGKYLTIQKYQNIWGADEIKEALPELNQIDPKDLGNEWGIFDEYLYSFIEEQLRTATRPQFFLVLTTSNHPPFEFPSSYNTLPLEMDKALMDKVTVSEDIARKRFLGLQYANQKVGEFLTKIRTTALGDKVVVALTGDHSYWIAKGAGLEEEFKRFNVPFYLSLPERLMPKNVDLNNPGSHEDIFPTLYNLTLSEKEYYKLGEDLVNDPGLAINSSGLVGSAAGAFHHDSFWTGKEGDLQSLEVAPSTPELEKMRRKAQAAIGLTDYYLKEEKRK